MDCDELLSYKKQDYYWPKSSYLNYFEESYIPPLKEELHVEENIVLFMEKDPDIKIIVEENNEDIIEKDLEVKMVETIEEQIIEEVVNDLDEVKLDDCNVQAPFILVVSDTPKFINLIEVDKFDSIVSFYLANLYNYMKTKEKEIQVNLFIPLMSFRYGKKIKGLKHSKNLFIWSGRFQISKMNSRKSLFQVEGSDVRQNLQFNFGIFM